MNLRSKLIRLASQNPELRGDLLPLLEKTGSLSNEDQKKFDGWAKSFKKDYTDLTKKFSELSGLGIESELGANEERALRDLQKSLADMGMALFRLK